MTSHVCPKCGYTTPILGNLKKHLSRKTPCTAKKQNTGDYSVAHKDAITHVTCLSGAHKNDEPGKASPLLRNFGEENMNALPLDTIRFAFMNLEFLLVYENLHMDKDFPENFNVQWYHQNVFVVRDGEWVKITDRDLVKHIYDIFMGFVQEHFDLIHEDLTDEEFDENYRKLEETKEWFEGQSHECLDEVNIFLAAIKKCQL